MCVCAQDFAMTIYICMFMHFSRNYFTHVVFAIVGNADFNIVCFIVCYFNIVFLRPKQSALKFQKL